MKIEANISFDPPISRKIQFSFSQIWENIKWRFPENWGDQIAVFGLFGQENIIFHHLRAKHQDEIIFFFQKSRFV